MKLAIENEDLESETLLPPSQPDGSKIGVNYADSYIKVLNKELDDGLRISCKRRGLKITLMIGDRKGEGLMRRLEHGPDARTILRHALQEAAHDAGASLSVENNRIYLELDREQSE